MKFSNNALDERFDRALSYDQAGRIVQAYSGSEARDFINNTNTGTPTGPYRQSYQYSGFNQVTQQTNRLWSQTETATNTFVNNRMQGWSYDAAGALTSDGSISYGRDAAGRLVQAGNSGDYDLNKYDGDGRLTAKGSQSNGNMVLDKYYLNSSVLGLAVSKLDSSGQRLESYVYAGRKKIATSTQWNATWSHQDPVTGSHGVSITQGLYGADAELNPDGIDVGFNEPTESNPPLNEEIFGKLARGTNCPVGNPTCVTCSLWIDASQHNCARVAPFSAEMARAEARYQSIYLNGRNTLGYDPETDRQIGGIRITYGNGATQVVRNPTTAMYQQIQALYAATVSGGTGYLPDTGFVDYATNTVTIFGGGQYFLDPQEPAKPSHSKRDPCATPNNIVELFKKEFEAQWDRTMKSGEENGSLIFWEEATNTYPGVAFSEGRHDTDRITSVPALPEARPETRRAFDDFRKAKRSVHFFAFFHTHPNFPHSGDSRSGEPSGGDVQYQSDYHNVLGIIRTGKGYSFFSNGSTFWPSDPKANECIWILKKQR